MNDLLKFFSKSLYPFGYHITKRNAPNILRIKGLDGEAGQEENIKIPRQQLSLTLKDSEINADMNSLTIYFRSCLRENRNRNAAPRVSGDSLCDTALNCLTSLVKSVNLFKHKYPEKQVKFICLDDHSSPEYIQIMQKIMDRLLGVEKELIATQQTGQGQSLLQQFSHARDNNSLCYFIEDDYLHEENAICVLFEFYTKLLKDFDSHSLLYTQDSCFYYEDSYPSYLILGEDRKWRTIRHATHSFLLHGKIVNKYWHYFENTKYMGDRKKRQKGSEGKTTNRLFLHLPGFVPLNPIACHLQFADTLPPFYDWKDLYQNNQWQDFLREK